MANTKDNFENSSQTSENLKNDELLNDGKNVTPQVSVKSPAKSLKDFFSMVSQFVSVGGDFV